MSSEGIEPSSRIPQTRVLSVELRGRILLVIARSEIIQRIIERRSNPVTMYGEFNNGIPVCRTGRASSPFRSLRSLRLLAMTDISIYSSSDIHKNPLLINIHRQSRFYFQNRPKPLSVLLLAKNIPRPRGYNTGSVSQAEFL